MELATGKADERRNGACDWKSEYRKTLFSVVKGSDVMKIFSLNIDVKSLFRKKPKAINDNFGVSFVTGYQ